MMDLPTDGAVEEDPFLDAAFDPVQVVLSMCARRLSIVSGGETPRSAYVRDIISGVEATLLVSAVDRSLLAEGPSCVNDPASSDASSSSGDEQERASDELRTYWLESCGRACDEFERTGATVSHVEPQSTEERVRAAVVGRVKSADGVEAYIVLLLHRTQDKTRATEVLFAASQFLLRLWFADSSRKHPGRAAIQRLVVKLDDGGTTATDSDANNRNEGGTDDAAIDETVERITVLFEQVLLKRSDRSKDLANLWEVSGRETFQRHLRWFIAHHVPCRFVLPCFPFKSGSPKKVLGRLPDKGERIALKRLHTFLCDVQKLYEPGAHLSLFSDGRVYCDLFQIHDDHTTSYRKALVALCPSVPSLVEWYDLDMFLPPALDHDTKRRCLVDLFGVNMPAVRARIEQDSDFREVYVGFKAFMREELRPEGTEKQKRTHLRQVSTRMMQRNDAYGRLVRSFFPHQIRLSIHPSTNKYKFSVSLVGVSDWGTPWHNAAVRLPNGDDGQSRWTLMRVNKAREAGYPLLKDDMGLEYFDSTTVET